MPETSDREAFRKLLVDYWAIRVAAQLDHIKIPTDDELAKYREIAAPRADEVLRKYEQSLEVDSITIAVVEKLRDELVPRSRAARLIEVAINLSAVLIGALIGLSQFIFDPVKNAREIGAVYYALLLVVVIQLAGNLYLKYFDRRR